MVGIGGGGSKALRAPGTVDSLLYGPPPSSDSALATLAVQLDQLESEVHST